jgi:hypothetical protein
VPPLLVLLLSLPAAAEEEEPGSYFLNRFATSYVGLSGEVTAGNGQAPIPGGRTFIPPQLIGRLNIGSYYFWGRADLFFSLPIFDVPLATRAVDQEYTTGIISGAHAYPWRLNISGFRPFVGAVWAPHYYRQKNDNGEGIRDIVHRVALDAGWSWVTGRFAAELGLRVMLFNYSTYFVSRTESGPLWLPALSGWLTLKYAIGTTPDAALVSYSERFAKRFRWAREEGALNGLGVTVGLAGAFALTSSSWNIQEHPFLGSRPNSALFPDFGLTFDIAALYGVVNLGFRPIRQNTQAYGFKQTLHRDVIALEYDQYLFEFQGFYPYIGVGVSYNALSVRETDNGRTVTDQSAKRFAPAFALGFDILQSSFEWLVFRTSLRYSPWLHIDLPGGKIWFDHLEIDYLQVVFFPGRLWGKRKE